VLIRPELHQKGNKIQRPTRDLFNILPINLNKLLSPLF